MKWNLKEQLHLASWLEENPSTTWEWCGVDEVFHPGSGSGWNPFEAIRAGATIRLTRKGNGMGIYPEIRMHELESALTELYQAMLRYEADVDGEAPSEHHRMMDRVKNVLGIS